MRKSRRITLFVTAALLACILLLAGGAALVPGVVPVVVPWAARQIGADPAQIWKLFVSGYNDCATASAGLAVRAALSSLCTDNAQVDWRQWEDMLATAGEITAYTLHLTTEETTYARGTTRLSFQHAPTQCYEVEFVWGAECFQIQALRSCSCGEEGPE